MLVNTCAKCNTSVEVTDLFCKSCGHQLRCKADGCGSQLPLDAEFCPHCGTPATGNGTTRNGTVHAVIPAANRIVFERKSKLESTMLDAAFTDVASEHLTIALASYIGAQQGNGKSPRSIGLRDVPSNQQLLLPGIQLPDVSQDSGDIVDGELGLNVTPENVTTTDTHRLREVFSFEGDAGEKLELIESRLKASGQLDYAKRLTYLFLYAHQLAGRRLVSRSSLTALVSKYAVNDSNFIHWMANTSEIRREDDLVGLMRVGEEAAIRVLNEVVDPSVSNNWMPDSGSRVRRGRNAPADDATDQAGKSTARKPRTASKTILEWIAKWKALNINIDGHDAIKNRTKADKAIFGLWAIRKSMGDAGKEVSRGRLAAFLAAAFEVFEDDKSLENALRSDGAKGKVQNVHGSTYQILPDGMKHGESLAVSASNPASAQKAANRAKG